MAAQWLRRGFITLKKYADRTRNHMYIGLPSKQCKVLYREDIQMASKWRGWREHIFTYEAKAGEKITAIAVEDQWSLCGGYPTIKAGGHGLPFVAIRIKSRYCLGFHFIFTVHGTTAETSSSLWSQSSEPASAEVTDHSLKEQSSDSSEACDYCGHTAEPSTAAGPTPNDDNETKLSRLIEAVNKLMKRMPKNN